MSTVADWVLDACDCGRPGAVLGERHYGITYDTNPPINTWTRDCVVCGQTFWFQQGGFDDPRRIRKGKRSK